MIYDLIIIGAGAAGLFAGASLPQGKKVLMIEKMNTPGKKLLLSGAGQCNLTHGGDIKSFISHYGPQGKAIRSVLYRFPNDAVMNFFQKGGIALWEREDSKVFPASRKAQEVLDFLVQCCKAKGIEMLTSSPVTEIRRPGEQNTDSYRVFCGEKTYDTKKLLISAGGCSYPVTGADGSMWSLLKQWEIDLAEPRPALVPLTVEHYPFEQLSGISLSPVKVTLYPSQESGSQKKIAENQDDLLFTHKDFSGPAMLNLSRYAKLGQQISFHYYPEKSRETVTKELTHLMSGNKKQLLTVLDEYFHPNRGSQPKQLPSRFLELLCQRSDLHPQQKFSQLSGKLLKQLVGHITEDTFTISKIGGFHRAMTTAGGVALTEVNLKTMESIKYPGLFFAGEILDVDGDTGGYNLQFAFSSGHLAATSSC